MEWLPRVNIHDDDGSPPSLSLFLPLLLLFSLSSLSCLASRGAPNRPTSDGCRLRFQFVVLSYLARPTSPVFHQRNVPAGPRPAALWSTCRPLLGVVVLAEGGLPLSAERAEYRQSSKDISLGDRLRSKTTRKKLLYYSSVYRRWQTRWPP